MYKKFKISFKKIEANLQSSELYMIPKFYFLLFKTCYMKYSMQDINIFIEHCLTIYEIKINLL